MKWMRHRHPHLSITTLIVPTTNGLNWWQYYSRNIWSLTNPLELESTVKRKVNKKWFYIAMSSPLDRSKHCTLLHFIYQTCSIWHVFDLSGKHSATLHTAQRLFTHISPALYSQVLVYRTECMENLLQSTCNPYYLIIIITLFIH